MGVDIHGWVEVKSWSSDEWEGVLRIDGFVYRDSSYDGTMFSDGHPYFQPIASHRGFPKDVSEEVRRTDPEQDWGNFGFTWAFWREIAVIDWQAVWTPPPSVFKYVRDSSGALRLDPYPIKDPPPLDFAQEGDVEFGDTRYRIVRHRPVRRDELLHPGWQIVFNAMQYIVNEDRRSSEDVRVVVWFNG